MMRHLATVAVSQLRETETAQKGNCKLAIKE